MSTSPDDLLPAPHAPASPPPREAHPEPTDSPAAAAPDVAAAPEVRAPAEIPAAEKPAVTQAAPQPAPRERPARPAHSRKTSRETSRETSRASWDTNHTGFPWEVSPLAHLSAAQIRAELNRRERRIAELQAEHARLLEALGKLETEIEDIEASLE